MIACCIPLLMTSHVPSSSTRMTPCSSYVWIRRSSAGCVRSWAPSPVLPALQSIFTRALSFPIHVSASRAGDLAAILGCPVSSFPQTYLGLPLSDRKLPALALEFLATKISRQIPSWRLLLIPIGGRLTLATTVLSALPVCPVVPPPAQRRTHQDGPSTSCLSMESRHNLLRWGLPGCVGLCVLSV
jgi:hypothetical protein